jgi:hypothetical protein
MKSRKILSKLLFWSVGIGLFCLVLIMSTYRFLPKNNMFLDLSLLAFAGIGYLAGVVAAISFGGLMLVLIIRSVNE